MPIECSDGQFPVGSIENATVGIERVQGEIAFLPAVLNETTAFVAEINAKRLVAALMSYRRDAQALVALVMQRKGQAEYLLDGVLFKWSADGYAAMTEEDQAGMEKLLAKAVADGEITQDEYSKCIRRTDLVFNHIELTRLAKSGRVKGVDGFRRRPNPALTVKG